MPEGITYYVITGIVAVVIAVVSFLIGSAFRKKKAEKAIGSAEDEARRILGNMNENITLAMASVDKINIPWYNIQVEKYAHIVLV